MSWWDWFSTPAGAGTGVLLALGLLLGWWLWRRLRALVHLRRGEEVRAQALLRELHSEQRAEKPPWERW
jgi:hypothetical protein